jgi:hypothetical protein
MATGIIIASKTMIIPATPDMLLFSQHRLPMHSLHVINQVKILYQMFLSDTLLAKTRRAEPNIATTKKTENYATLLLLQT